MTPLILAIGLGLIAVGGVAWTAAPLMRRRSGADEHSDEEDTLEVGRVLGLLDELDRERERGALSESEHRSLSTELGREAASHLRARDEQARALDTLVETWVSGAAREPAREHPDTPVRAMEGRRDARLWLLPSVPLAGLLIALVLVVTLGTRGAGGAQTVVGNVGAAAIAAVAAAPDDPSVLLAAHPAGLQRSADGGASWSAAPLNQPLASVAAAGRLYALGESGLLTSEDGVEWAPLPGSPNLVLLASGRRTGALVGVSADGQLLQSRDSGGAWRELSLQLPTAVTGIAIIDQDALEIVLSTRGEGVLISGANGAWRSANGFVNGALPTVSARAVYYEPDSGDRYQPASGEEFTGALYVATDAGVFKSVDGMQSWRRLRLSADVVALTGSAAAPRTLFAVARDGSVYRSGDAGVSWS